jgi:hypothetical protein
LLPIDREDQVSDTTGDAIKDRSWKKTKNKSIKLLKYE